MASINYLWKNRIKYPIFSYLFLKCWVKRILLLGDLLKKAFKRYSLRGAILSPTSEIGEVVIKGKKNNLIIGDFSTLGKVEISLLDKVFIGNYVCINDGCTILTASHEIDDPMWKYKKAEIHIEDYAWISTNTILLPGVTIGKGAVIGAGCVVSKSVPPYSIAIGNPMRLLEKKRTADLRYNPCEFLALNSAWLNG